MTPTDSVSGLVAHFDLASSAPGRDLADGFSGLRAAGKLKFTPWGVAFGDGGSLSSATYSGGTLTSYSLCLWVRHDGSGRVASGSPLYLETVHTAEDEQASRERAASGGVIRPGGTAWGEGFEFHALKSARPTFNVTSDLRTSAVVADPAAWGQFQLFVASFDAARGRALEAPTSFKPIAGNNTPVRTFEPGKTILWIGPLGEASGSGTITGLTIAEARVYDHVLTAAEVEALRQSFNRRRVLRATSVAWSIPRYVALHTVRADRSYSEGVWAGAHQHLRVDPLPDGGVSLAKIDWDFSGYAFHRLGVQGTRVAWGSNTRDANADHERWNVIQAASGRQIFVSNDWRYALGTTEATGGSETWLNLELVEFKLDAWPEFQTWGTGASARAAVDFMARPQMLPLGWFAEVRQADRELERIGTDTLILDASGLVSGSYTRAIPEVELPKGGVTVLAWFRVERDAPVQPGGTVMAVMLGSGGGFNLTVDLETRTGANGAEHCIVVYTNQYSQGLRAAGTVDHTMQLITAWVDLDQAQPLLGARLGASTQDVLARLPPADAAALSGATRNGGRLTVKSKPGVWKLSAFEVHAGRLPDADLIVRDIVMRERAAASLVDAAGRLPVSFTLFAPSTGRYLAVSGGGGGAPTLSTTADARAAVTWVKEDQAPGVFRIKRALADGWLKVGQFDDPQNGRPAISTTANIYNNLRARVLPSGHLAFEDLRNTWMRASDSTAPVVKGTDPVFAPTLGADHSWTARASPLIVAVPADPRSPSLPDTIALWSKEESGYLSVNSQFDYYDDKHRPLVEPLPTWWVVDRTHIAVREGRDVVYLLEPRSGKYLGASAGLWVVVSKYTEALPIRFVALADGRYAFRNVDGAFLATGVNVAEATSPSSLVDNHKWTVTVLQ